ncbi:signal peptidase I [Enterococcus rivorum]|uniref:Signal peptidase I n=1 Tax=Enterococcus rivorum TaxID=762845 RepID=A0A1E5L1F2_9ENTE|nr:signal peptidase I [Enterococcus rivorum]OEH83913.1 signal peptidase I [Enterococcus rivorum]
MERTENTENRPSKKKSEVNERKKPTTSTKSKTKVRKKKRRKLTKEQIRLREKKRRVRNIIEIIKFSLPILIVTILVFLFILNTSPHMVEGNSMNPTLKNKDRVIVRRTKEINRYDVITFKPPVASEFQYVKRVIGMPGDLIWLEDKYLFINQQTTTIPKDLTFANQLPDGTIKVNISKDATEQLTEMKKIPKDFYFVLGDNRENSSDSREFGLVNNSSIEGVVSFRFAPFNQMSWIK